MISYVVLTLLVRGPHFEEDNGVFLSGAGSSFPSLRLTNWFTEQSELKEVEIETLKCLGEQAPEWASNRLSSF